MGNDVSSLTFGGGHVPAQPSGVRGGTDCHEVSPRGVHRWETMFHHYHPRLVSIIKVEMNCQCSTEQAEEIAASV